MKKPRRMALHAMPEEDSVNILHFRYGGCRRSLDSELILHCHHRSRSLDNVSVHLQRKAVALLPRSSSQDIPPPPAPFAAEQRMAARGECSAIMLSLHGKIAFARCCSRAGKIDLAAAFNAAHAEGCACCVPKQSALKPGFWRDVGFGEEARPGTLH